MIESIKEALFEHAKEEYPRECCGVVIIFKGRFKYIKCRNISDYQGDFEIQHEDFIAAEKLGEVVAICHSHPNARPIPSDADKTSCEIHGLPWIIIGYPTGEINQINHCGFKAPLVGRKFVHGVHDCYSLAQDYYKEELNIELPNIPREDRWWEKGQNVINIENIKLAGFVEVPIKEMRLHDAIIMQNESDRPNHIAVYLGDNIMLHQCIGRLSSKDVYGGYWLKNTRYVLRHQSLL